MLYVVLNLILLVLTIAATRLMVSLVNVPTRREDERRLRAPRPHRRVPRIHVSDDDSSVPA